MLHDYLAGHLFMYRIRLNLPILGGKEGLTADAYLKEGCLALPSLRYRLSPVAQEKLPIL
jgi:hypothetical protein